MHACCTCLRTLAIIIVGIALAFDAWLGIPWAAASIVTLYQLARVEEDTPRSS